VPTRKKTGALIDASKKVGVEINSDTILTKIADRILLLKAHEIHVVLAFILFRPFCLLACCVQM
jgi:hypothetical protein